MTWLWPSILVFVGGSMAVIGGLLNSYKDYEDKVLSEKNRADFETQLRKRSDEIASLNREIAAYSKGEGSYCYFEPTVSTKSNAVLPALVNVGNRPLYDVRVRVLFDPDKLDLSNKQLSFEELEKLMTSEKRIDVGSLPPSNVPGAAYPSLIVRWDLPPTGDKRALNVFFSARNDQFIQFLRFRRVNGRWLVAFKVFRDAGHEAGGKVLREFVQPGYPRNSEGKIDWQ